MKLETYSMRRSTMVLQQELWEGGCKRIEVLYGEKKKKKKKQKQKKKKKWN